MQNKMTRALLLIGSAIVVITAPVWTTAQTLMPATQPVAPTISATTAPTAASAMASTSPALVRPKSKPPTTQISMRFKDAPIDAVLQHLSEAAGYQVIKGAPIDGRVTVWSDQPITPEKAVELLNSLLKQTGYTAILQGTVLKVSTIDKAKKGSIPVRFGADPDDIALTDDLITQVIPLKSVDAIKLKADLQPLVGTDADLTANAASNSVIITDTSANIHRVVEIISSLDKRNATENDIIVQQLKYADATATAKLITDIFKPADAAQTQQQQFPFFGRGGFGRGGGGFGGQGGGAGGNNAPAEDSEKGNTGTITASADTRTNTIVVTGPKDVLATIQSEILSKIDNNPAADQKFFIYHVKNGQAVDMQTTLNTLFGVNIASTSNSNTNRSASNTANRASSGFGNSGSSSSSLGGSGGFGTSSTTSGNNRSSSNSNTNSNNNSNSQNRANTTSAGSGLTGAVAALIGQVEVVADSDTNSLLVLTATKYEDDIRKIILELDRPVPQVLIKVLIAEVTHDRSDDLGLDFSILNLSRGLGGGTTLGNIASNTANGGLAIGLVESQLSTTFHALAVAGKLDVLSRPYILTSDNQEANILVGQNVPFITNSRVTDDGQLINTINYQDIGIILDVTPHINPDGLVVMDVSPQISSQSDQTVPIQAGVNAPVFNTRSASSHVGVRDGDTIVIGGLMQDQKTQTVTKVPILGDIPYLGLLFQRDNVTKTKTELLIFLTPHVAPAPDHLQAMSVDEMKGVHLTPGAVQPGTFQEHINGMRLGGSATQPVLTIPPAERDRDAWEPEPRMP